MKRVLFLMLLFVIFSTAAEAQNWILVDKSDFKLELYEGNNIVKSWDIAVGLTSGDKQRKGDMRTPNGTFSVVQIQNSRLWTHDFKDGKGVIRGAYGPWFIRLKTPQWSGIGIHGTHAPESIGTQASEGCIRLRNDDIEELRQHIKIGMKVVIRE